MNRRSFIQNVSGALVSAAFPARAQFGSSQNTLAEMDCDAIKGSRAARGSSINIGNLNAFYPGGIAFIKDNQWGIVLDVGWDATGRPGIAAPDHSVNCVVFERDGAHVGFDWARIGPESVVGRLTTDKDVRLTITIPARPWKSFNNVLTGSNEHGVQFTSVSTSGEQIRWELKSHSVIDVDPKAPSSGGCLRFGLSPGTSVHFVAGFNDLPEISSADRLLKTAAERYSRRRARIDGNWGDFAGAIADNINNSQLYSSLSKRVATVIGRDQWIVTDPDFLPYFTWDTSFNALLASLENPKQGRETIRTLLSYQLPDGMVPQFSNWNHDPLPFINFRSSNPPVTSLCVWKMHERWPDRKFLAEVYPHLLRWHDWWPKHSDGNGNGLLEWGAIGSFLDARLACGWDDTPAFDGAKQLGTQMNADAVDLNSLWSMDAEYLACMADELGLQSDASRLREEHEGINRRINDHLWNEELGLYCSRLWDEGGRPGEFLSRVTPMNFYPLICGAPNQARAARIMLTLTDPKKFWGQWLIPTLPYDDPDWHKQDYWKGHTWAPVNYLVWQGVKRYGTSRQRLELAERSVRLFMTNWTERGTCNEAYMSSNGMGDRHPHYTWGALLCQIGLEYVYDANHKGGPQTLENSEEFPPMELRNMPSGGNLYRITCGTGGIRVTPEVA